MDVSGAIERWADRCSPPAQTARRSSGGICIFILAALFVSGSQAQELGRPSFVRGGDSLRASSLSFDRVLNTFLWTGGLFYARDFGSFDVDFRQEVRSRLIRTEQQSIQDEYIDTLDIRAPVGAGWRLMGQQMSSVLSDNRAIDLAKLAQHEVLLGFEVAASPVLRVGAMGGYEFDSQQQEQDEGFSYEADAEGSDLRFEEFRGSFRSHWEQAFLSRRKPNAGSLEVVVRRQFGDQARNTILLSYERQRREFYVAADGEVQRVFNTRSNIFQREEEDLEVSDSLGYRPAEGVRVALQGGIMNRLIDRGFKYKVFSDLSGLVLDTRIQELQLYGMVSTSYQVARWLDVDLNLTYQEREEKHSVREEASAPLSVIQKQERSERRLENIAGRTTIATQLHIRPTQRDQLNFAGSASILRYDTPDTLNIDDRDELLITLGVQGLHRLNDFLTLTLSADVTLNHLVYLKALQSANNNWNRIIRLSPGVEYTPVPWFRTINQAEVLANYTVYDFEDQAASARSFSFRQASWMDSTSIQLSQLFKLGFVGGVRVYERGTLLWKEFKEHPQDYFVEESYWPSLMFSATENFQIGVGFRFFGQDRYRYDGPARILDQRLDTSGPTVACEWWGRGMQRVALEGWRETQTQDGQTIRTVSNLSLKVSLAL
jgi:hypothetical protein